MLYRYSHISEEKLNTCHIFHGHLPSSALAWPIYTLASSLGQRQRAAVSQASHSSLSYLPRDLDLTSRVRPSVTILFKILTAYPSSSFPALLFVHSTYRLS